MMSFVLPSLVVATLASSVLAQSLSCPSSNATTYVSGANTFVIQCGVDYQGGDLKSASTNTFQGCIDLCSADPSCIDVAYSGVACYMKSSCGTVVNNGVWGARLQSTSTPVAAASVSALSSTSTTTTAASSTSTTASATPSSTSTSTSTSTSASTSTSTSLSCPASDGTTYVSTSGSFIIECGIDRAGGDLSMVYVSTLGACIAACASTAGCVDVSFMGNPGNQPCYMKSVIEQAQSNSAVWGARLLSSSSSTSSATSTTSVTSATSATNTSLTSTIASSTTTTASAVKATATPTATSNAGTGCGRALPVGQTAGGNSVTVNFTQSDGTARSYLIHIPATYSSNSKTPLLYSFHGASSTGANQEGLTGFSQASNNPNAIVVYPNGVNGYWQGAPYSTAGINDVAFVQELTANLSTQYCIDSDRTYASGFSNGGGFVGTLACDANASKLFAAFGANSGAFYQGASSTNCNPLAVNITCNPGRQHQPFLEIHGSSDGQISYTGGVHNSQCMPDIRYYMTQWSVREGYGSTNTTTALGSGNYEFQFGSMNGYSGVVTHIMVNGLGHDWSTNFNNFSSTPTMMGFFNEWVLSTET